MPDKFYSLSPQSLYKSKSCEEENEDFKKIKPYLEVLDTAIKDRSIYNIALMGSYGSGKSTIIKTFESKHTENTYLNLSLTSFAGDDVDDLVEKLEVSILKQMIYKTKYTKIPYSQIKRIKKVEKTKVTTFSIVLLVLGVTILYFWNSFEIRNNIMLLVNFLNFNIPLLSIEFLMYFLFIVSLGCVLYTIIKNLVGAMRVSKLNIFKNLEVTFNEEKSVFNSNIDEIMYFFEETNYSVVVIEDVDRFNKIKIFEHLRELNFLLNESEQIQRKITFIYALKEDMFNQKMDGNIKESYLRTKFFEFIIPVVPILNSSNARDYLLEEFKVFVDSDESIKTFLREVSLYIDDMRILNNILGEYQLLAKVLDKADIKQFKRMFSMVVFKVIEPNDYSNLQKSKGILFSIIDGKEFDERIIKKINEQYEKLIEKKEIELTNTNENINSKIIDYCFFKKIHSIEIDNERYEISNNLEENIGIFEKIKGSAAKNFSFYINNNIYNASGRTNKEELLTLGGRTTDITEYSRARRTKKLSEVEDEISAKIIEKNRAIKLTLREKINTYQEFYKIELEKYKSVEGLIKYLLLNGLIDEYYYDYIVLYKETYLTKSDQEFVKMLKSNNEIEFDYRVTNIKSVSYELSEIDFTREGIVNRDIINYCFDERIVNVFLKKSYCTQIKIIDLLISEEMGYNNHTTRLKNYTSEESRFLEMTLNKHDSLPEIIMGVKRIEYLFLVFFRLMSKTNLVALLGEEKIKGIISHNPKIFDQLHKELPIDTIIDVFSTLGIQVKKINFKEYTLDDFYKILENPIFEITLDNIESLLEYYNNSNNEKLVISLNSIEKISSNLFEFVNENFYDYIRLVIRDMDEIYETEDTLLKIINFEKLEHMDLIKILKKNSVLIGDANEIGNTYTLEKCFEYCCVSPKYENINVFLENGLDIKVLNEWLNDKKNINQLIKESNVKDFEIMTKKLVGEDSFFVTEINISIFKNWNDYHADKVNPRSLDILLSKNLVDFSVESFPYLNSNQKIQMIENRFNDYKENCMNVDIGKIELYYLVSSENKGLEDIVEKVIFSQENNILSDKEFVLKALDRLIFDNIFVGIENLRTLFEKIEGYENTKLEYLSKYLKDNRIKITEILDYINLLGGEYTEIGGLYSRVKLENNERNMWLAKYIDEMDLVSSIKVEENYIRINGYNILK